MQPQSVAKSMTRLRTSTLTPRRSSIFELVVNTTEDGTTKRIGAWTGRHAASPASIAGRYRLPALRQTVETLAQTFENKRRRCSRKPSHR